MRSPRRGALSWIPGPACALCLLLASAAACSNEKGPRTPSPETARPAEPPLRLEVSPAQPAAQVGREDIFRTVSLIVGDLKREPLIKGYEVRVRGGGRSVVLAGSVPGAAARERVLQVARVHIGGFTLVDSLDPTTAAGRGSEP